MENKLEKLLRLSAEDPGQLPRFYETLLDSEVYVLGNNNTIQRASRSAKAGEDLDIVHWLRPDDQTVTPMFSSLETMWKTVAQGTDYLRMPARDVLAETAGQWLVLNPHSPHGKEFTPQEAAALLSGDIFRQLELHTIEEETEISLSDPDEYPHEVVAALNSLFETMPAVEAAYLTQIQVKGEDDVPRLAIAIKIDPEWGPVDTLMPQIGFVTKQAAPTGPDIDFTLISDEGLGRHLPMIGKCFYTRGE